MPWKEVSTMSQRHEFIQFAQQPGTSLRALCRRFGISPPTAYIWLTRYAAAGPAGLADRSRPPPTRRRTAPRRPWKPRSSRCASSTPPGAGANCTPASALSAITPCPPPAPSPRFCVAPPGSRPPIRPPQRAWQRFEHATPNALWQMDFKGHFRPAPRPLPSPDGAGRLLPLRPLPARLSQ